jgi:hypothetical protein
MRERDLMLRSCAWVHPKQRAERRKVGGRSQVQPGPARGLNQKTR